MRVRLIHSILLIPLLLTGCDFFYSTVNYTGPEAEPHLCVEARFTATPDGSDPETRKVFVSSSAFFLDAYGSYVPYVDDAVVTAQVNRGVSVSGTYIPPVYDEYTYKTRSGGYYSLDLPVQAGDSVLLRVEHPAYGRAEAWQVCPAQQPLALTVDSISRYGEVYGKIHLPGYRGNPTDVVTLTSKVDRCQARLTYQKGRYTDTDTVIVYEADSISMVMYTKDDCFDKYHDKQSSGYYASYSLTLPASAEDRTLPVIMDSHIFTGIVGKDLLIDNMVISIRTEVRTIEDYDYYTSLHRALDRSDYAPPMSSQMTDEQSESRLYMEDVIESIREAFDELGNVEESQIYGNLDGERHKKPIGCFSLVSVSKHVRTVSKVN